MFLSVRAGLPLAGLDGKWRGGVSREGRRLLVGGAEALYCCHKSYLKTAIFHNPC